MFVSPVEHQTYFPLAMREVAVVDAIENNFCLAKGMLQSSWQLR